jgi:hypothetical protein
MALLSPFSAGMTAPTFNNALVLIYGTILAPGRRTVTAALCALGLAQDTNYSKYHRVLNKARWSPLFMSRVLLGLLIGAFVPEGATLVFLIDETLERRRGKTIGYKGWFRDAVRSSAKHVALSLGIRWCCVCLLVQVPWTKRAWALPFLVVPVLSEKTCQRLGKRHRSGVQWAILLVEKLRNWLPDRKIVLVGDGGYAAIELVRTCRKLDVTLIARLRFDAKLYEGPAPQPKSKRGPKPKKGKPQLSFKQRLVDEGSVWQDAIVPWYAGTHKAVKLLCGSGLWHQKGADPVSLRFVLVQYEEEDARTHKKTIRTCALLCSDTQDEAVTCEQIVGWFVGRWNIEVTFEEIRAHLGFETQRHWSQRAIERTTPALFGLFSLVVLMAHALHPKGLPVLQSAWYPKEEATFSDALAAVRTHLWTSLQPSADNNGNSAEQDQRFLIPRSLWNQLQFVLSRAA